MIIEETQFVEVPIPRLALPDVLELVAQRLREFESEDGEASDSLKLDEKLVRRMYEESQPRHRELMKLLATRPDEWVYTSEIAKAMKLPHGSRSSAGMFGAFGRRAAHRYAGQKPWDEEWDPTADEARYRMPTWIAQIVGSL